MNQQCDGQTHEVQWRKTGYWAPGPRFSSEEVAMEYADLRVDPKKRGLYRIMPVVEHGELSVEQCLVMMRLMQVHPHHWRRRLGDFLTGRKPMKGMDAEGDKQALHDIAARFPKEKLFKLNPRALRNKLAMADARERAAEIAKDVSHVVTLDHNPEVMTVSDGAFVQAWVFVPNRTEDQRREREFDIATYLAGETGSVPA